MRVAHVCLSNWYVDGVAYQENELVKQHVADGHDVLVIASTETQTPSGRLIYCRPGVSVDAIDVRVLRLPYLGWPPVLARKLRIHPGVYKILDDFQPDAILFHGTCGWEVGTVARYAEHHPEVLFYIDSHEDRNNSARTLLSSELLHKIYYRWSLQRALKSVRKILCISTETIDFVEQVYRVPRSMLEFFPLAGRPVPQNEYQERRTRVRAEYGVAEREILFVQSGKQTRRKKLLEALAAFRDHAPRQARLLIAGSLHEDIREQAEWMIAEDPRIRYLGWKDVEALTDLLCAADVYLQPGTQSVTMQHSLCCHCAVILDDVPSHHVYFDANGWLVKDQASLESAIASTSHVDLAAMQERSYSFARRMLDYAQLSKRVLRAEP